MPDALSNINLVSTPQTEQADASQVPNSAGGWTFTITPVERLRRFLTIGTDGGTYYASERALTRENAAFVIEYAQTNCDELLAEVVAISTAGRAPRQNPALFALAVASAVGDSKAAAEAFGKVVRTGTHLFTFLNYRQALGGWNRSLRRTVGSWYTGKDADKLAYQVLKYRQREGWTHRDVLRKAHPNPAALDAQVREVLSWIVTAGPTPEHVHPLIDAYEKAAHASTVKEWVSLIEANPSLSWEMLPDEALGKTEVWEALVRNGMPQTALMRQLPRLTRLGVIGPGGLLTLPVAEQLQDTEKLKAGRVHPFKVLLALRTYAAGTGARGTHWEPVPKIVDALDAAFYNAFGAVEPTGKRQLLALDVSGSMGVEISSKMPITCREASGALAMVTAAVEPDVTIVGFTSKTGAFRDAALTTLDLSPRRRLDDNINAISGLPFGGTDCSLPALWARESNLDFDAITIYTDNETWAGREHPFQALKKYRNHVGHRVTQAVVGMTATDFSIANPTDADSLDVAGMDASVPELLSSHARS